MTRSCLLRILYPSMVIIYHVHIKNLLPHLARKTQRQTILLRSVSEGEGTIDGGTKVLQNIHVCNEELEIKSYFLKYFDTVNKEAITLIAH